LTSISLDSTFKALYLILENRNISLFKGTWSRDRI
jgi:hypothetical protein